MTTPTPIAPASPLGELVARVEQNPATPPDAGGAVAAVGAAQAARRASRAGGFPKGARRDGGRGKLIRDPAPGAPSEPTAAEKPRNKNPNRRTVAELEAEIAGLQARVALQVLPDDVRFRQAERMIQGLCAATELITSLLGVPEAAPDAEQVKALEEAGAPAIAPYVEAMGEAGKWVPLFAVVLTIFITNWKRVNAARAVQARTAPVVLASEAPADGAPAPTT